MQSDFVELHLPIHFDPEKLHRKSNGAGIKHRLPLLTPSMQFFFFLFFFCSFFHQPFLSQKVGRELLIGVRDE